MGAAEGIGADAVDCNLLVARDDDERNLLFGGPSQRFGAVNGILRLYSHAL